MNADEARQRSISTLRSMSLPANFPLPAIEEPAELSPPLAEEVARRCLVLGAQVGIGFDDSPGDWREWIQDVGLRDTLSLSERAVVDAMDHSEQEKLNATWLTECIQVLAWGLGFVDLDHFRPCDEDLVSHFPHGGTVAEIKTFVASAALRPFDEIYQECDLLYHLHWLSREAGIRGAPTQLEDEIIRERHKAINWLAGVELDWDEVPTDT